MSGHGPHRRVAALAALPLVLAAAAGWRAQAQPARTSSEAVRAQQEARILLREGRTEAALDRLDQAPVRELEGSAAAEVEVMRGDILASEVQDAGSVELGEAMVAYRRAIEIGTPEQAAVARNNIGSLHYATGRWQAAIDELSRIDLAAVPAATAHVYRFNLGRALVAAGRTEEAGRAFFEALRRQPAHEPSVRQMIDLLVQDRAGEGAVDLAVGAGEILLESGQLASARRLLDATLPRWSDPRLWALLPRLLAASPDCSALPVETAGSPRLAELRKVLCAEPPPAALGADESPAPHWSEHAASATALADLVVAAGDRRLWDGRPDAALDRYAQALRIDRGNGSARRRAAIALRAGAGGADRAALIDLLIARLDEAEVGDAPPEALRDLLATRLALADAVDQPAAALAILEPARGLQERLERAGDPPAPGLHERLARLYRQQGDRERARGELTRAAEAFLATGDLLAAEDAARVAALMGGDESVRDVRRALAAAWVERGRPQVRSASVRRDASGARLCVAGRFPRPEHALLLAIVPVGPPDDEGSPCRACELVEFGESRACFALPRGFEPGRYRVVGDPVGGFSERDRVELAFP